MQAALECRKCGGVLEAVENQKIVYCKFCGSANIVSIADRFGLYNRANYLRRKNEFDRAINVYEDILKEDPYDSEAYFGIALCKYGIEYVDDPGTEKKVPTCHRTRITLISNDADFQKAINNADPERAEVYAEEAAKIDKIITRIQQLSAKQEKYDIFICYKETDEKGERTKTSVYAQDIYQTLTKQGYKVFFARKTLEQKLGSEYEPIIFAALFSAKVMLVVGDEQEQFQAVWVKNEWSRYMERITNGDECTLIPIYRDISPYELPQEFANLQALNMDKIGFIQDLLDGLQKLLAPKNNYETIQHVPNKGIDGISAANLKKRAFLFLEQGDFSSAGSYFERALDSNPEDAESYWGKMLVELRCKSENELKSLVVNITNNQNYQMAIRFATEEQSEHYKYFADIIQTNIYEKEKREQEEKEAIARVDAELQKKREKEIEYQKLEHERKRKEAKARNKILRKKALKVTIVAVIMAVCLPIICFIIVRVLQYTYLKTENVCGLYNLRNRMEDFLRETDIYYKFIIMPNGYNDINLDTDFFMGDVDGKLYDEIMRENISESDWEELDIQEYHSNGFSFGVTQDGELCYRCYGNESDLYVSERATYYTLRELKKELGKKGRIKQLEVKNGDYLYCVMENGDVEFAILDPIWIDYDSEDRRYKKIENSGYEIPKWNKIDKIRFIGEYILAIKNNGDIVYHNCEPDFNPELVNLDKIDFDAITYQELMDNYAVGTLNVEYAIPVEE